MNHLKSSFAIILLIVFFKFYLVNSGPIVFNNVTYTEEIIDGDIIKYRKYSKNYDSIYDSVISADVQPRTSTWPEGVIPFVLDDSLQPHKCIIYNGMLQIMLNSCVKFRAKTPEDGLYLRIFQDPSHDSCYGTLGCDHEIPNRVSLPNGCFNIGTVVHELMHVLGFYHLQNRHDRDQYLRVYQDNIDPAKKASFRVHDANKEQIFVPWDFDSIMLYGKTDFSIDGLSVTMEPLNASIVMLPVEQKAGLSRLDVVQIRQLYNCPSGFRGQNFHRNPHLIAWFKEVSKLCSDSSSFSLYMFR